MKRTDRYSRLEEYFSHLLNWFSKLRDYRILIKDEQFNVAVGFLAVLFGNIRAVN